MRLLRGVIIAGLLTVAAVPASAGKRPPLVVAVDKSDSRSLARLLKKATPKDLDAFDADARSPTAGLRAIEVAARKGDEAAVDALLAAGATATAKALELAAGGGQLAMAQQLVEHGAPRADLALTAAAKGGFAEVVEALLPAARQADPYFNLDQVLEFAVYFPEHPSAKVVELLLRERANPAIAWGPGKQTVLHLAVAKGAADVVAVLLAARAPVDAEDGDGTTPLVSAVRGARFELANALLAAGADPKRLNARGEGALSALVSLEATDAAVAMLDRLLAAGVAVDAAGKDGLTPLMVAAGAGSRPWVEKLLAKGASVTARTADGRMPIDLALACTVGERTWAPPTVSACHADVALALLAKPRAPVGGVDELDRTPFMRALMTGDAALADRVLALGGAADGLDHWGNNALHYAARWGTPETVTKLLARMPRDLVDAPDNRGETPLSVARGAGRPDIEQLLEAAGAHWSL
ncbi:MAG TPA: ankyrin repeat domain-containing protein [Kofleriaceae bacterium]|nr:ankyrin repeat domain-containing protein [Kofleriaceae bacterium]